MTCMYSDRRSAKLQADLAVAKKHRDCLCDSPMRRHYEQRVRELEAEIHDHGRSSFLLIDPEAIHDARAERAG